PAQLDAGRRRHQQESNTQGERHAPEPVEPMLPALDVLVQDYADQRRGKDADRNVDVEDPPPADRGGDQAANRGADDGRDTPDAAEEALHPGALPGFEDVPNNGEGDGLDGP